MNTCIFCDIVADRAEASFVYRDVHTAAFMSLEQPNPYKALVVPTAHIETLYDLSDAQAAELFKIVVKVARAIRHVSGCEGLNLVQSSGAAGQQDVAHLHVHLLPRWSDDAITLSWPHKALTRPYLDELATDLRQAL